MKRLPANIARLLPDGHDLVVVDLTLFQAMAIIRAASDALATAQRLLASLVPANWHEDEEWVAVVDWLGGIDAVEHLRTTNA